MANYDRLIVCTVPFPLRLLKGLKPVEREVIMPFTVRGKLFLEKEGKASAFPDDIIGLPDLDSVGTDNLSRVMDICTFLDRALQEKILFLKENDIDLFSFSYFYMKILMDAFLTSYAVLDKLFRAHNFSEIIVIRSKRQFSSEEEIVVDLLELVFSKRPLNIRVLSANNRDHKAPGSELFKSIVKYAAGWMKSKCSEHAILANGLVINSGHDIPYFEKEMVGCMRFIDVKTIARFCLAIPSFSGDARKTVLRDAVAEAFKDIEADNSYRALFPEDEYLFAFINKWFKNHLDRKIVPCLMCANKIKMKIGMFKPSIAVTSGCRFDMETALIFGIIRALKIPVVTYQEGGGAGYMEWPLFNVDAKFSDYFLVYGEDVKKRLSSEAGRARLVPTGSLRLGHLKNRIAKSPSQEKTICVILDNFKENVCQHYPYNGGFFSYAYRHQLAILDALKSIKGVNFVLKTMKGREVFYEEYESFMKIETRPLVVVLDEADAFILEYPSTVLQECLLADKPIALLYDEGNVRFEPDALKALARRVRMCSDPSSFRDTVTALMNDIKTGTAMTREREFQARYCLTDNVSENIKEFYEEFKRTRRDA